MTDDDETDVLLCNYNIATALQQMDKLLVYSINEAFTTSETFKSFASLYQFTLNLKRR